MAEKKKSGLDKVMIAAPCPISWDSMEGDDRVRFCKSCSRDVYDLSQMTRKEAEQFLAANGSSQCMRFYRRADGTIMTSDCPVGLRLLQRSCRRVVKLAAAFLALLIGATPLAQAKGSGTAARSKRSASHKHLSKLYEVVGLPPPPLPGKPEEEHIPMGLPPEFQATTFEGGKVVLGGDDPPPGGRNGIIGSGAISVWMANRPILAQFFKPETDNSGAEDDGDGTGVIKLRAQYDVVLAQDTNTPLHADSRALDSMKQARIAEQQGNLLLSLTHYRDALKAAREQAGGDPAFTRLLESEVQRIGDELKAGTLH